MEKYNIIQRVLERNGYGNTTVLLHKTPLDYIKAKMHCDTYIRSNYKINVEVETVEITDETVWMEFTHVIDHDEEVDFITDVYIAPRYSGSAITKGTDLIPAVFIEEHKKDLWREAYFVYDNKLIAILAVGNVEICCKLCDIPEHVETSNWLVLHEPEKLSRAEVKDLMKLCQTIA